MSTKIAVLALDGSGHHRGHIKIILDNIPGVLVLTTTQYISTYGGFVGKYGEVEHKIVPGLNGKNRFGVFRAVENYLLTDSMIGALVITNIDQYWISLLSRSLFRFRLISSKTKLVGYWLACNYFYKSKFSPRHFLPRFILQLILKSSDRQNLKILMFNESICEYFRKNYSLDIRYSPDPFVPVNGKLLADNKIDISSTVPVLLMAGHHSSRKGTEWALNAFKKWSGDKIKIIIAGKIENIECISRIVADLPKEICVKLMDEWVDEVVLANLYNKCSCVLLPYRRFGSSSGIFVNSLYYKKLVICPDWGLLGFRTKYLDAGYVFDHDSPENFLNVVEAALKGKAVDTEKIGKFLEYNCPERFASVLLDECSNDVLMVDSVL